MYGLNFTGLRKRDTYDEIVDIVEKDRTIIKYPNRQATQLLNSPYMKQINGDSLMDIEKQQSNLMKEKMKDVILQQISGLTGIPHIKLRAEAKPQGIAVRAVDSDMEANERRDMNVEDMRGQIAGLLDATQKVKEDKSERIAQTMRETHEQGTEAPMAHEMAMSKIYAETQTHPAVEHALVQTSADIKSRHTQTPIYREDEMRSEYAQQIEEATREKAYVMRGRQILEHRKNYVRKMVDEHEANRASRSAVGKAFSSLANTFGLFAPNVASSSSPARRVGAKEKSMRGWWNEDDVGRGVVGGSNPVRHNMATPRGVAKSEGSASAPMRRVKSEGAKSEALSSVIKKGKGSSSQQSFVGLARPVGNTPAPSHGTVKSESSKSKSYASGMALPVGGSARSHSGVSYSVGSAVPASSGASRVGSRNGQAISVASSSNGQTSRGKPRQKRG